MNQKLSYAAVLVFFLLCSAYEKNYTEEELQRDFNNFKKKNDMDIASCYDMYMNCSVEDRITPFAVSHSNIQMFCYQIALYNKCIKKFSKYNVLHCLFQAYISEDQENFEVKLLSTAFRIYYFLCLKNDWLLHNWDRPLCFAQKFRDCVSLNNVTACLNPCPEEPDINGAYPSSISSYLQTVMAVTTSIAVARMMVI
ncbi:hypothetical protein T02_4525 [Trichinella nativa]|uniref:Uncharacterized protein n=1 Tax=Trichinella nativa TaxID=6335 RepID=A0A0V1L3C1_9BILA|nr:hypothetical protein T02_4525 [Trichinella nativa]